MDYNLSGVACSPHPVDSINQPDIAEFVRRLGEKNPTGDFRLPHRGRVGIRLPRRRARERFGGKAAPEGPTPQNAPSARAMAVSGGKLCAQRARHPRHERQPVGVGVGRLCDADACHHQAENPHYQSSGPGAPAARRRLNIHPGGRAAAKRHMHCRPRRASTSSASGWCWRRAQTDGPRINYAPAFFKSPGRLPGGNQGFQGEPMKILLSALVAGLSMAALPTLAAELAPIAPMVPTTSDGANAAADAAAGSFPPPPRRLSPDRPRPVAAARGAGVHGARRDRSYRNGRRFRGGCGARRAARLGLAPGNNLYVELMGVGRGGLLRCRGSTSPMPAHAASVKPRTRED